MRNILLTVLIAVAIKGHSQVATEQYVKDAITTFSKTLDSTVVNSTKITTSNQTINLDTLTIPNNSSHVYKLMLETNEDVAIKIIQLSNVTGTYTIVSNKDELSLSRSFLSSVPKWNVSISNNKVVVSASGVKNKTISWRLSKTIL